MEDYFPPVSPDIVFLFNGVAYVAPASPDIVFIFGADGGGGDGDGALQSSYFLVF